MKSMILFKNGDENEIFHDGSIFNNFIADISKKLDFTIFGFGNGINQESERKLEVFGKLEISNF